MLFYSILFSLTIGSAFGGLGSIYCLRFNEKIWKQKNDRTMETTNKVLYSFILASLLIGNYLINCTGNKKEMCMAITEIK